MAVLFGLSSIPGQVPDQDPEGLAASFAWVPPTVQNGLHLPAYGLLGWLWFRGLLRHLPLGAALAAGISLTVGYGILDEWHQAFVPGRFPSATDGLANALGAGMAAGLFGWRHGRPNP
ncbi:VanZ family protein [Thiohalorhabdus sp.]